MRRKIPFSCAALAFLAALGCGGDSCGSPPPKSESSAPAASGGGPKSSGSGEVGLSRWDSHKRGQAAAPKAAQPAQNVGVSSAAIPAALTAVLGARDVLPEQWRAQVLKAAGDTLVLVTGPACPDCAVLNSAIQGLSSDFTDWSFKRLDLSVKGAEAALPKGMGASPPPGLIMYQKGMARSRRKGMPFPRDKDETDEAYQARLGRWLRDALTQKSLTFAK